MNRPRPTNPVLLLALAGAIAIPLWLLSDPAASFALREPGMDDRPAPGALADEPGPVGILTDGVGTPGAGDGSWPGFRGPNQDGMAPLRPEKFV